MHERTQDSVVQLHWEKLELGTYLGPVFPTLQVGCGEIKQTQDMPDRTLHSAASHEKKKKSLISNPAISSHTVWMCS